MQSISFALLVAMLLLGGAASAQVQMETTNAMPENTGGCKSAICSQGVLTAQSLIHDSNSKSSIAFVNAGDFPTSTGWPAGNVTDGQANAVYGYGDSVCHKTLTGFTVLRILRALVASSKVLAANGGVVMRRLLQFAGLRVTYSTTLPATGGGGRLTKVEWWNKDAGESGAFVPFNRTKLYGVSIFYFDTITSTLLPYKNWWGSTLLPTESSDCSGSFGAQGLVIRNFLGAVSPYTLWEPEGLLIGEASDDRLVVGQNGGYCKGLTPAQFYDATVYSCLPCPDGEAADADGTACVVPTPAPPPDTAAPATDAPAASTGAPGASTGAPGAPATAAPAGGSGTVPPGTAAPAGGVPSASGGGAPPSAPATPAPDGPSPASGAPSAGGSAAVPHSGASATTTAAPVVVAPGGGAAAGASGAKGSGGAPVGAIVGGAVGAIALVAVVAAVVFVMKKRAAAVDAGDGLDDRLTPLQKDAAGDVDAPAGEAQPMAEAPADEDVI